MSWEHSLLPHQHSIQLDSFPSRTSSLYQTSRLLWPARRSNHLAKELQGRKLTVLVRGNKAIHSHANQKVPKRGEHLWRRLVAICLVHTDQAEEGPSVDKEGHIASWTGFEQSHWAGSETVVWVSSHFSGPGLVLQPWKDGKMILAKQNLEQKANVECPRN